MRPRHLGLSSQTEVEPLLKTVNGMTINRKRRVPKDPSPSPSPLRFPDDGLDISRLPESSSDEKDKEAEPKRSKGLKIPGGLSDDELTSPERPSPPAIKRTQFEKKKNTAPKSEPAPRRMATRGSRVATETKKEEEVDQFIKQAKRKNTNKISYGSKLRVPLGSQLSESPKRKRAKLIMPRTGPLDSPERKPGKIILPDADASPLTTPSRLRGMTGRNKRLNRVASRKEKSMEVAEKRKKLVLPDDLFSDPSETTLPPTKPSDTITSFSTGSPLSTLPDLSSSDDDNDNNNTAGKLGDEKGVGRCPMCDCPVSASLLASRHASRPAFATDARLQLEFCTEHRTASARERWEEQGYPTTIDWEGLDERLGRHDRLVRSLLSDSGKEAEESPFVATFREKVRSGQERTLLQAGAAGTTGTGEGGGGVPGYYGPRGGRRISEFVTRRFATDIRKWAVGNMLVSVRGVMAFVQSVVVPELAVRLVMEDMNMGRDQAGKVLDESREVGELLNEDYGDHITGGDIDEEEECEQGDVLL